VDDLADRCEGLGTPGAAEARRPLAESRSNASVAHSPKASPRASPKKLRRRKKSERGDPRLEGWRGIKSALKHFGLAEAVRRCLAYGDAALVQRLVAAVSVRQLAELDATTNARLVLAVSSIVSDQTSPPHDLLVWLAHNRGTAAALDLDAAAKHRLDTALTVLSAENSDRGVHAALLHHTLQRPTQPRAAHYAAPASPLYATAPHAPPDDEFGFYD
jgi:hypothetical protein